MSLLASHLERSRRVKAVAVAILLALVLVVWRCAGNQRDPLVKTTKTTGQVRRPSAAQRNGQPSWIETVSLPDQRTVPIWFLPPRPRAGERVPLRVLHYRSGAIRYELDRIAWQSAERLNSR